MSEKIEFSNNYHDLSTDRGFQFEFFCNRCSNGYRTKFQTYAVGTINNLLDNASSLFGGIFSSASSVSEKIKSATWQKAKDEAFIKATEEISPDFVQCPRCQSYVCREKCWNTKRGLCKECAPDLGVEMSAAQASKSVEEIWAHAAMAEEDKKLATENWRETIRATCPKCEAPLQTNAKFCPECGEELKVKKHCTNCGALVTPGTKFCAECGNKI
jgi:membrane protease subunit (stomatin/prohibitin family)